MITTLLFLAANLAWGGTPPRPPVWGPAAPVAVAVAFAEAVAPSTLVAAGDGVVWVVDAAAGAVLALDAAGGVNTRVALPETETWRRQPRPLLLAPFPGGLWLWDVAGERGFVWFAQAWQGPFPLAGRVASLTALPDGSAVVNTPAHPAGSFAVLTRGGELRARFGSPPAVGHAELAAYYDTWVVAAAADGFLAAGRYLPRLVRYRRDGTRIWERIPQESGLAALERSRLARLERLRRDCASGCIDAELVEFASLGQGLADGSSVIVFSRRARLDHFAEDGRWLGASRLELPPQATVDPVGLAVVGDALFLGVGGALVRLPASAGLGGRVVDPALKPVEGAKVSLASGDRGELETRTAADGGFSVPAELVSASVTLEVQAAGFLSWRRTGVIRELIGEDIVLEPEPVVCVQVVKRGGGAPVRRFTLQVAHLAEGIDAAAYESGPPPVVVDNEDGRGCLASAWKPPLHVEVCAEGFACATRRLLAGGEVRVELDPEAVLVVEVHDTAQRPVAGAAVQLLTAAEARRLPLVSAASPLETDAAGVATFAGRSSGEYVLKVEAAGFGPSRSTEHLQDGENVRRVTLEPGSDVTFVVRDASGEGVAEARVWVSSFAPAGGSAIDDCLTDGGGRCRVAGVPAGRARALASHRGEREVEVWFHVPPPAGEVAITFPAEGRVEGEVVGLHHYPDVALAVIAVQQGYAATSPVAADGRFRFAGLKAGQTLFKVVISGQESGRDWVLAQERHEVGRHTQTLRLRLPPPLRVQGSVTAARRGCGACVLVFALESGAPMGFTALTAGNGAYRALLASPGSYLVEVRDRDSGRRTARRVVVNGDQRWDVELDGIVVEGTVVLASTQEGVAGARVRLFDAAGRLVDEAPAGAGGAFRFTDLAAGEVVIVATRDDARGQRRVRLSQSTQQVVVEISAAAELLLNLVDGGSGAPVGGVMRGVVLAPAAPPWPFAQPMPGGRELRLPAFAPGEHTVVLRPGQLWARTTVRLAPGAAAATVTLWPRAVLEVLLPRGERAAVEVAGLDGRPLAVRDTFPFFVLEGAGMLFVELPPGTYDVLVRRDGPAGAHRARVTLAPFERVPLAVP